MCEWSYNLWRSTTPPNNEFVIINAKNSESIIQNGFWCVVMFYSAIRKAYSHMTKYAHVSFHHLCNAHIRHRIKHSFSHSLSTCNNFHENQTICGNSIKWESSLKRDIVKLDEKYWSFRSIYLTWFNWVHWSPKDINGIFRYQTFLYKIKHINVV